MQYGFIGVGNMGGALAQAVCRRVDPARVAVSGRRAEKAQEAARRLGCRAAANEDIARECGMIFLGVKPQMMAEMLRPLQGIFAAREEKPLLVSMAAGLTLADIGAMAGGGLLPAEDGGAALRQIGDGLLPASLPQQGAHMGGGGKAAAGSAVMRHPHPPDGAKGHAAAGLPDGLGILHGQNVVGLP